MRDFLLVVGIGLLAASLTYVGVPIAERFDVPSRVVNAALQFAAGFLIGTIVLSLLVPAVKGISAFAVVVAFFVGGSLFVALEYFSARRMAARSAAKPDDGSNVSSVGLYVGVLGDMLIDGTIIGIGAALSLVTGLRLGLGLSVSQTPLAFVATATAKKQGMPPRHRRFLGLSFFVTMLGGALVGYLLLKNQSEHVRLALIAVGAGFLLTAVTQGMIPEAIEHGKPNTAAVFFVIGLTLFGALTLVVD